MEFHDRRTGLTRDVSPDQLALPGMEHLSHPWARQAARGLTLTHEHDPESLEHVLWATRPEQVEHPLVSHHAVLQWGDQHYRTPGEITWVYNDSKRAQNYPELRVSNEHGGGRGIAGDMMRSAHYFDVGQDTVPIHSPARTTDGNRFADKVMPHLKPERVASLHKTVWPNRPPHPYEVKGKEEEQERVKQMRAEGAQRKRSVPMKQPNPRTGSLF